jgi:hypothetical protein
MSTHVRTIKGESVKIQTSHNRPPIRQRDYDWSAVTDDYEAGHPIGHGATEDEAIANLVEQLETA